MKNLISACQEAMDAFEEVLDEDYPAPIRDKIACVVEDINTLRAMAEEAQ